MKENKINSQPRREKWGKMENKSDAITVFLYFFHRLFEVSGSFGRALGV